MKTNNLVTQFELFRRDLLKVAHEYWSEVAILCALIIVTFALMISAFS